LASNQALHRRYGIAYSTTDDHDCHQNALAERVDGIPKLEFKHERLIATPP